jgi:Fur family transcriptional regulator, ferric uptake regulator
MSTAKRPLKRATRQRDAIRAVIGYAKRPLSAREVLAATQARVPSIGIATVYRNLKLLLDAGEVEAVTLPGENPYYESAHLGHHHHFQCTTCERVFDVPEGDDDLGRLAPRGFSVEDHQLTLYGRCGECRGKRPAARPGRPA